MEFKNSKQISQKAVLALYDSVGWVAYTAEPEKLVRAITHSLAVITAWDEGQLIGLIRAVGDGETILYVQDILVHPSYQNQGVGSGLMEKLLQDFPGVRQKVLLTEEAPDVRHFYEKWGFTSANQGQVVAFYREY